MAVIIVCPRCKRGWVPLRPDEPALCPPCRAGRPLAEPKGKGDR